MGCNLLRNGIYYSYIPTDPNILQTSNGTSKYQLTLLKEGHHLPMSFTYRQGILPGKPSLPQKNVEELHPSNDQEHRKYLRTSYETCTKKPETDSCGLQHPYYHQTNLFFLPKFPAQHQNSTSK